MLRFVAKLMLSIGWVLLIAAQCQPPVTTIPTALPPTSTPNLVPPIQAGDGTDLMDRLLKNGLLRVGIRVWPEPNFSPPAFRGASNAITGGSLNGFEVDIARLLAENLGLELELIEASPLLIASGDWQGEWDIALASLVAFDQPLPGTQANKLVYSQPYGYIPLGLLIPTSEQNIHAMAHLANHRVGVLEHSVAQRILTPADTQMTVYGQALMSPLTTETQLVILSNLPKSIRQLDASLEAEIVETETPQLDAIFGPVPVFEEAIKQGLALKLAPEASKITLQPLVIATVSQDGLKTERLISEINKILTRLQRQGALAEVYYSWYEQDFSQAPQ